MALVRSVMVAASALSCAAAAWGQVAPLYELPMYSTGGLGYRFVLADFDRDGRVDAAATGSYLPGGPNVFLLRGTPGGSFGSPVVVGSGAPAGAIESHDLDRDGRLDLIYVVYSGAGGVYGGLAVSLARARGGFHPPVTIDLGAHVASFVIGDVDVDGDLDVVAALAWQLSGVQLLRGRGDGTFDPPLALSITEALTELQLVDFDGDATLDLVGLAQSSHVSLVQSHAGLGGGAFGSAVRTRLPSIAWRLAARDLDGDGVIEVVIPRAGPSSQQLVELHQLATDGAAVFVGALWSGNYPRTPRFADVDGDGQTDITLPHGLEYDQLASAGVAWLRSLPNLAFEPARELRLGGCTQDAHWSDLEGDGDLDLVTINDYTATSLAVLHAHSPGDFEDGPVLLDAGGAPIDLALGDLDGDGRLDLAATTQDSTRVELWRNRGAGDFELLPVLDAAFELEEVVLARFNGDARADVAAVGPPDIGAAGTLWVWRSSALGLATPDVYPVGSGVHALEAAELDGDGRTDLGVSSHTEIQVLHARTNGTFEQVSSIALVQQGPAQGELLSGDFDGDGKTDLALISHEYCVWIAFGLGQGHFEPLACIDVQEHIWLLAAGDLDLDGRTDLLVEDRKTPGDVYALYGRADRDFEVEWLINLYVVHGAAIADLNGNGLPDIAALDQTSLQVITGDGTRGFDPPRGFGLAHEPRRARLGDLDLDGRLDLVTALPGERRIAILLHR